ncbi:MAG TPA: peptidase M23, partial [Thermoanaerobacterales bacterium]|nr:peptidase M23 [Thermoanaerobacterales bacterium]
MNLKRLKPWAALLAVIIMIIAASPATAANIDDLRKKQKDISSQIENLKQNINRVNNSKKTVVDEIAELERQLVAAQKELDDAEAMLRETQAKLANTTEQLKQAEERVEEQKDDLN